MKEIKIILDTNLWISFLITNKLKQLDDLISNKKIRLIFSNELLEEFIDVANRPKFKKYFSQKDIEKLLKYFDQYAEFIEVKSDVKICQDIKDNFLLNLSIDAKADYLITGDNDLLILKEINSTQIITYTEFLNKIG